MRGGPKYGDSPCIYIGTGSWGPRNMAKPKIQNEKCCQGMPAKSHLEAYVSKQDFRDLGTFQAMPGIVRQCLTMSAKG